MIHVSTVAAWAGLAALGRAARRSTPQCPVLISEAVSDRGSARPSEASVLRSSARNQGARVKTALSLHLTAGGRPPSLPPHPGRIARRSGGGKGRGLAPSRSDAVGGPRPLSTSADTGLAGSITVSDTGSKPSCCNARCAPSRFPLSARRGSGRSGQERVAVYGVGAGVGFAAGAAEGVVGLADPDLVDPACSSIACQPARAARRRFRHRKSWSRTTPNGPRRPRTRPNSRAGAVFGDQQKGTRVMISRRPRRSLPAPGARGR
jgi:hypothetical protein